MQRSFDLFEQFGDVVKVEARLETSQVARLDLERLAVGRRGGTSEAPSQRLVDHVPEGTAGTARERPELGRNIVVEGQGGAHILMLIVRHHDVKIARLLAPERCDRVEPCRSPGGHIARDQRRGD